MKYELRQSADGSLTLYSKEYGECYHSLKDGALTEALRKHVLPAFELVRKPHLRILDICFGLGINTLATIDHFMHQESVRSLEIFSPELDADLLATLADFRYPARLMPYRRVIEELVERGEYRDENIRIELYVGDAREYVKRLRDIDVVYQDAFSPKKNPSLWTLEYFCDIAALLSEDGIVTTYSIATPVRLAMHEAGLRVYEMEPQGTKKITIASKRELPLTPIDMEAKKRRASAKVLRDEELEAS